MKKHIKITLIKSVIGRKPKHIDIVRQLGLKKINSTVVMPNSESIKGLLTIISYLIKIEEC